MKRSVGVTAAAITVLVFSVATLALLFQSFHLLTHVRKQPFAFPVAATIAGLIVWGTVTGIELLRLRPSARASILLFASFNLVCVIQSAILDVSLVVHPLRNLRPDIAKETLLFAAPFYVVIAGLCAWWLLFFMRPGIKLQFESHDDVRPQVPLGLLLVGVGLLTLAPLLEGTWAIVPARFPRVVAGFFIHGIVGPIYNVTLIVVAVFCGIAILRRRIWILPFAMGYCAFVVLADSVPLIRQLRGLRYEAATGGLLRASSSALADLTNQGAGSVILALVATWVLWTRRAAFYPPRASVAPSANVSAATAPAPPAEQGGSQ